MLRISKLTDYGVVVATHLAGLSEDEVISASEVAIQTEVPLPTVSKVLKRLSKGGVVEARRGVRGGYRLSRSADAIGMNEVIEALEGPIAITECAVDDDSFSCEYAGSCAVQANWQRINQVIASGLAALTLADMMPRPASAISQGLVALRVPGEGKSVNGEAV